MIAVFAGVCAEPGEVDNAVSVRRKDLLEADSIEPSEVICLPTADYFFVFLTPVGFFVAASLANRSARKRAVFSPRARRSAS